MAKVQGQGTYAKSELLSHEENRIIEQMYAPKREVLACSVAQLFHAAPNPRVWAKQQTGVIVLVKDHNQRSYFMQFVNIDTHSATYSEELYLEMDYKTPYTYFHSFPGERCMVGINFCRDSEAQIFHAAVSSILSRNKRRKDKLTVANQPPATKLAPAPAPALSPSPEPSKKDKKDRKKKDKKGKKKGITKADISGPSNFQHLSHLGWDKDKNQFDESQIHPALRDLLETAGIKATALKDEGTAEFIKTFVENNGGMDTLVKEKQRRATIRATSTHGRGPPPAPPAVRGHVAPPPPSRSNAPPPPSRNAQPPPPVPRQQRGPQPPPTSRSAPAPPPPSRVGPPPPPSKFNAPTAAPAPPPPPPPGSRAPGPGGAPAPPTKAPAGLPPLQGGRGGLLDQIKAGRQLKTVTASEASSEDGDTGNDLLAAIRNFGGAKSGALKMARADSKGSSPGSGAESSRNEPAADADELEGMAGALARALASRNKAIGANSDQSDDDESDDDWSD